MHPRFAAILALGVALALPAVAQEPSRQITVVGAAEADVVPDIATITAGVETRAATASAALDANSKAMAAVFAALEAAGIERRDVQTSQLSLNPVYSEGSDVARVSAYEASNMVMVRVRDVPKLGAVIDGLATAGVNRFYGIGFEVADPRPTLDTAREHAVADARARAELYARAAGVTLGPVVSISEASPASPGPVMMRAEMDSAAPPVSEGTVALSTQVTVVYAIQ
jgi:uncharacterized protein YggE